MSDNVKRALRTGLQALIGIVATGGLSKIWESYSGNHAVDPTISLAMVMVLTGVAGWAQNVLEDQFGGGFLVPQDKVEGQRVMGENTKLVRNMT